MLYWSFILLSLSLLTPSVLQAADNKEGGRRQGFFSLVSQFVRETIADANRTYTNISMIVRENFPSTDLSNQVAENVTTEATITLQNVTDILSKNYRSLRRLFSTELSAAFRDSRRNVARYRAELRKALFPYFGSANKTR